MKTLLVTTDFPPLLGGIANYYFNRVEKMPADEIVVLTNHSTDYNFKIYNKKFFTKIIWPHWLPLIWHIFKIVKKEKIQRIWVGQVLPVGTAVWIVCKILKLPYFITCHGNDLLRAKSHFRKYKLAKKILNFAKFVEANTEFTKNILINNYKINKNKIKIVYPVCTLTKEMADKNKITNLKNKYNLENKKILLTISRLVESKGIDQIIKALEIINDKTINYLIIGDGPEKNNLKKLAENNRNIYFPGPVAHSELPNYYALADAFIMIPRNPAPSTARSQHDTESFGIVYLEAQEFGLPIIASDTGGTREALKNCNNFTIVDPEDINEIVKAIKNL